MTLPADLHRWLLLVLLLGNAVAFAGVDPVTRMVTAILTLVLVVDLRRVSSVPRPFPTLGLALVGLVAVQLVPLPGVVRRLLQPGLSEVIASGIAPLSVAPWATVESASGLIIALGLALTASRMASTRSGLPSLLAILALTAGMLAVLGLVGEASGPGEVLVRGTTVGGHPYGPYVNRNHFAQGLELSLPALLVLAVAAVRNVVEPGPARQRALAVTVVCAVGLGLGLTAMLRSGSRGGIILSSAALLVTLPWWWRTGRRRRWPILLALAVVTVALVSLLAPNLTGLGDSLKDLFVVEGVEGNTRWDLWRGAWELALRSPLVGCGLGAFRFAAGLDKPATGIGILEQAHNDWLEWAAETGLVGCAILLVGVAALLRLLWPVTTRKLRFEYRYAAAGCAVALTATALHEVIGFGLQTPLNTYLAAIWLGIAWSLSEQPPQERGRAPGRRPAAEEQVGEQEGELPGEPPE